MIDLGGRRPQVLEEWWEGKKIDGRWVLLEYNLGTADVDMDLRQT
jgi:hypothetical protein